MFVTTLTKVHPGYDCMFAPCQHETKGEHGIRGDQIFHAVKTELEDGRAVFLVLHINTDRMPDTVPPTHILSPSFYMRDLALHVQAEVGRSCEWMDGGKCDVVWDATVREADEFKQFFPDITLTDPVFQFLKSGSEEMWQALRAKLETMLADPNLFPQADETEAMRDVRTRYDSANAATKSAIDRYQAAQKDLWHAIGRYTKGDPGYRRR